MISRSFISFDGGRFQYLTSGNGQPILYLHGFPTSGYLWRKVMDETAGDFQAIAPDFPGYGDSDLLDGPHTWQTLIEWLDRFVSELGLAPVHLAVHDWGGLIGLAWACMNTSKIRSLLITDTSFRSKDRWHAAAQQWRTPKVGEQMMGSMTRDGLGALLTGISKVPEDATDEYWKGLSSPERIRAKLEMYRSLDFEMLAPLEGKLPEVAPGRTRVIWGAADPFLPGKVGQGLSERLGAEITVIEGASHFLQEDAGEEVGRLHLEFLTSL